MSDQPKYPVGTLLRHRASGQKVIVTAATYKSASPGRQDATWHYELEADPLHCCLLFGDAAVDLRYEPVDGNAEVEMWKMVAHNALLRMNHLTPPSPPDA